ncbi:hypothetical protein C7E18_24135, partial [Stenotrophomonas maltophilia]
QRHRRNATQYLRKGATWTALVLEYRAGDGRVVSVGRPAGQRHRRNATQYLRKGATWTALVLEYRAGDGRVVS